MVSDPTTRAPEAASWRCPWILAQSVLVAALGCGLLPSQIDRRMGTTVVPAFTPTHPDQIRPTQFFVASAPRFLPHRTQYGYATSDFTLARGTLLAVAFRPPQFLKLLFFYLQYSDWHNPPVTLGLDVSLSHGASLPSAFSRTFAANHGPDLTVVFSGQVTWPRWTFKDDETQFIARIPFQRPFPFDAARGQSIVLDIRTLTNSRTTDPQDWQYEVATQDQGGMLAKPNVPFSSSCHPGPVVRGYPTFSLYPGGSWQTDWKVNPVPFANAPAVVSIGFSGAGGKWGNLDLPIWVPRTNCPWGVASELFWSFSLDANGYGAIRPLPIPNVQAVVGLRFFDQCAALVPRANPLGVIPLLPSNEWGIGTARVPQTVTVWRNNDIGHPDGGILPGQGARVEFTYH